MKRATGREPPELQVPPAPPELHFVLPVWRRLSARRPYEQGVALPIRHSEIEAFCRLSGTRLRPWEVEAIEALDNAWLAVQHAGAAK